MVRIKIYTWSSLKSVKPAKTLKKAVGYILRFDSQKGPVELGKTVLLEELADKMTQNESEIEALKMAVSRINTKKSELEIYTENAYVARTIESGWIETWKANGWKTTAGKPVANRKQWEKLSELLEGHTVHFHVKEEHEYKNWLRNEVENARAFVAPAQQERTENV